MRSRLPAWRAAGASHVVLKWLTHGVRIPGIVPETATKSLRSGGGPRGGGGPPANTTAALQWWYDTGESAFLSKGILQRIAPAPAGVKAFFVPKNDGAFRLILDGRPINEQLEPIRFRMETLDSLKSYLRGNLWALSFDVADAFYHIQLDSASQALWTFALPHPGGGRVHYRMVGLPMGYSRSPMILTKVLKVLVTALRREGISVFPYLDDFLVLAETRDQALWARGRVDYWLKRLGITRKPGKGQWDPVQRLEHLGVIIDLENQRFEVPSAKVVRAARLARELVIQAKTNRRWVSIKTLRSALGYFQSLSLAVPGARAYQRTLWDCYKQRQGCRAKLDRAALRDLAFWEHLPRIKQMRTYHTPLVDANLTFDASTSGWGAELRLADELHVAQGFWAGPQTHEHINRLELLACLNALRAFGPLVHGLHLHIEGDNQSVQHVLGNLVSRSSALQRLVRELITYMDEFGTSYEASWVPTDKNPADKWSRVTPKQLEDYAVDRSIFESLTQIAGFTPRMDLFGSAENKLCKAFISRYFEVGAYAVNAFSIPDWGELPGPLWINPPWSELPRVIQRLVRDRPRAILIVPYWQGAPWWPSASTLGSVLVLDGPIFTQGQVLLKAPKWRTAAILLTRAVARTPCSRTVPI